MRPEVVRLFRLALKHEETAGLAPWFGRRGRRRWISEQQRKHFAKAEKLYAMAARLESRNLP